MIGYRVTFNISETFIKSLWYCQVLMKKLWWKAVNLQYSKLPFSNNTITYKSIRRIILLPSATYQHTRAWNTLSFLRALLIKWNTIVKNCADVCFDYEKAKMLEPIYKLMASWTFSRNLEKDRLLVWWNCVQRYQHSSWTKTLTWKRFLNDKTWCANWHIWPICLDKWTKWVYHWKVKLSKYLKQRQSV